VLVQEAPVIVYAALFFAFLIPVFGVVGVIWLAVALCKAACRGDEREGFDAQYRARIGLSEEDVVLCQGRQRSRRGLTVMAGACGLTSDVSNKRCRDADTGKEL
jgi:hypothetical protein